MCIICQARGGYSASEHIEGGSFAIAQGSFARAAAPLPSFTLDQQAQFLTDGYWIARGSSPHHFDVRTGGSISVNITALRGDNQGAARLAMQTWTGVSGITFVETAGAAQVEFSDNQAGAYTAVSWSGFTTKAIVNIEANWANDSWYKLQSYIHEIGHALGLGHAGNYSGSANFGTDAHYQQDSWQYSVMSYFPQDQNPYSPGKTAFAITPMMADILAVQNMYGTATNVRAGNDTYGDFRTVFEAGTDAFVGTASTIFDSGGVDTFNFSLRGQNQMVDLHDGSFSNIDGAVANLGIARGTIIENAITGSGWDRIIGNDVDNRLDGGDGNDALWGMAGNDVLIGGRGWDTLDGGTGTDTALYAGRSARYAITYDANAVRGVLSIRDTTTGDTDTLVGVDKLAFDDVTLDVNAVLANLQARFGAIADGSAASRSVTLSPTAGDAFVQTKYAIDGAFTATATVHFDNLGAGAFQRVFDFSNGPWSDNVWLGQNGNTDDMAFSIVKGATPYTIVAKDVIVQGETAMWTASVDDRGFMQLFKNGKMVAEGAGAVPDDVGRGTELVGSSAWSWDTPLVGAVVDLYVANGKPLADIDGAFVATATARFDNLAGGTFQRIFDTGNGPASDNVWLGQVGSSRDMAFDIYEGAVKHSIVAKDAIVQGQEATWTASVNDHGVMRIFKDGMMLAEGQGVVPRDVDRAKEFIGQSNWGWDTPLIEKVASVDIAPAKMAIPEIHGAFTAYAEARFDDLRSGSFQRIFDTGNGPDADNIWLGQVGQSDDMAFEILTGSVKHRIVASHAIVEHQTADWQASVDDHGLMRIFKDGHLLAQGQGSVPADLLRSQDHIGSSSWSWDAVLKGAVTDLMFFH